MKKQEEVKRGPKRSQQDGIRRKPGQILKEFRRIEVGRRSVIRKEAVRTRSGGQGKVTCFTSSAQVSMLHLPHLQSREEQSGVK